MDAVIQFTPDGLGHCLYTEAIPLSDLGILNITRASTIEYSDAAQCWEVVINVCVRYSNPSREKCLAWEHTYFTQELLKEEPEAA